MASQLKGNPATRGKGGGSVLLDAQSLDTSLSPTIRNTLSKDYMSKQSDLKSLHAIGSSNLYVGKRSQAVNSDIEGLLIVKKKAKKIIKGIISNRGNQHGRNQRTSNLMSPSPPLTNFKAQQQASNSKKDKHSASQEKLSTNAKQAL